MQPFQIAVKELFPIEMALEYWGKRLRIPKCYFCLTIINAVVEIINKRSSRDPVLMKLLRHLVLVALKYNIHFRAKHIAGKQNLVADKLSRLQFQETFQVAPWLNPVPTNLPDHLLHI